MYNLHDGNKNNLRTIEAQTVKKPKNNEARPKFTGSYKKKKRVHEIYGKLPVFLKYIISHLVIFLCTIMHHLSFFCVA